MAIVADKLARAIHTHHHRKIIGGECQQTFSIYFFERGVERLALHEWRVCLVLARRGAHETVARGVVDGLYGQFGVQFAQSAVAVHAVIVIHAVSDVAGLLHFGKEHAGANGVDASGGQEEHVAGLYLAACQHCGERVGLGHVGKLFSGETSVQAADDARVGQGIDDIPHLGLAQGSVEPHGQLVVGVNLHRQVVARIDELEQERERGAILLEDACPHQARAMTLNELAHGETIVVAACHRGLVTRQARYFPGLAHLLHSDIYRLELCQPVAAP